MTNSAARPGASTNWFTPPTVVAIFIAFDLRNWIMLVVVH